MPGLGQAPIKKDTFWGVHTKYGDYSNSTKQKLKGYALSKISYPAKFKQRS